QALAQGRSLCERGYAATIVTFRHDRAWPLHEVIEGVPVIRVAGVLLGGREKLPRVLQKVFYLLAMVVMGWTLWRQRFYYDILHVYQLTLLTLPTALVCRVIGKSMIIAVRCADSGKKAKAQNKVSLIAGPLDATAPWLQVDGEARAEGDLKDLERLGKLVVRITRSLLKRIGAVVVVLSSRMEAYLKAHDFILPDTRLIPNGVDITRFAPINEAASFDERAPVVVCASRLCYQKGIDVLLQAWYLVQKKLPEARLIIIGIGPIQTQLEHMTKELGLAGSVEFAGLQRDVPAQLHRGRLAVLSSRFEGMPNAVLEAMACGLPCVATRVSGSEDIIQHGVNGLLVESEDYQGMAQALLTLLCDPALAQQYGRAARATIEQHYSLEHITDMYTELYQRLANHKWQKSDGIGNLPSAALDC
ncbi:MAG: glycosyltransferase family 4 protein, partial [Ktedonobacteraceae bacterium]